MFQPRTSSYTTMRGYHWAISYSALSRPMRSEPSTGTSNEYCKPTVATPPRGMSGDSSSISIIVSSSRPTAMRPFTSTPVTS